MLYAVTASRHHYLTDAHGNRWRTGEQLPLFFIDGDVQGCRDVLDATAIARRILGVPGYELSVCVVEAEDTMAKYGAGVR